MLYKSETELWVVLSPRVEERRLHAVVRRKMHVDMVVRHLPSKVTPRMLGSYRHIPGAVDLPYGAAK